MQAAASGGASSPSSDRNDEQHSIVSDLVSLIEQVQAGVKLLEAAIARETASSNQEATGNVFVLDVCHAGLGAALHHLLDTKAARHETGEVTESDRRPVRLINRA
jgi:hypothetical protein